MFFHRSNIPMVIPFIPSLVMIDLVVSEEILMFKIAKNVEKGQQVQYGSTDKDKNMTDGSHHADHFHLIQNSVKLNLMV